MNEEALAHSGCCAKNKHVEIIKNGSGKKWDGSGSGILRVK
jgi:hypothetical protein